MKRWNEKSMIIKKITSSLRRYKDIWTDNSHTIIILVFFHTFFHTEQ